MHAVHIGESDLPFVDLGAGSKIQLLHVDLRQGLWVIRTLFELGYKVETHYHTGPVFAVTHSGCWYYKEYPDNINTKGSYQYMARIFSWMKTAMSQVDLSSSDIAG